MPATKRRTLLPQARALHREGVPATGIASSLGVSRRTIDRWRASDEGMGNSWDAGQTESPSRRLRRRVEERLLVLADAMDGDEHDLKLEDRMLKLCRVLDHLPTDEADIDSQFAWIRQFVTFCLHNLTEDEMPPIRRAVRLFLDDLKERNS
jgi:hypothetical protein